MRVVVSGSNGGVGGAVVDEFLTTAGAEVHGLCRSRLDRPARSERLHEHELDLADADAIAAFTVDGTVDVLVHCAALGENMSFDETTEADWQRYFAINVVAAAALTKHLMPQFAERAAVVFLNSGLGLRASGSSVPYSSSKAALKGLADSIRPELNARGVSVTTVFPGQISTPLLQRNVASLGRAWEPERYIRPRDLARLIVDLATTRSSLQLTDVVARPLREPW